MEKSVFPAALSRPRQDYCPTCKFRGVDKNMNNVCRFKPPTAAVMPVPTANGFSIQTFTMWPVVQDSDWCKEYAPDVVLS